MRGLSPNFHIDVALSNLYIPRIGPHIFLQQNRQTDPETIEISHRHMSVGTGRQVLNLSVPVEKQGGNYVHHRVIIEIYSG